MKKAAFLVNGSAASAMGERAASLAARLIASFDITIVHRGADKRRSIADFLKVLKQTRPDVVYVFDMAYSGVVAALWHKARTRTPVVIDTGDAIGALARSAGLRGPFAVGLTVLLEQSSLRLADRIVVRGSYHQEWLARRGIQAVFVPDGVNLQQFHPMPADDLRDSLGLKNVRAIGLVGSSIWSERLGLCYGWELVELIRLLRSHPVKGLMIGSGTGIAKLRQRCRELEIEDRIVFTGHLPYAELPRYLNAMDICLSTQTNDLPGQVRTTGKLPLYLACGRFVLSTRVGQAARILPPAMLVDYEGVVDPGYPDRLAARVIALRDEDLCRIEQSVALAATHFNYDLLAGRAGQVMGELSR